ncbi:hypothetical protein [Acidithiobacillus thiooxidans]|uniref:hypothetical protein n=1 Tax=Acidithiobacillus thiooxidans TaxID=930 RepID=UPI000AEDF3A1|nr:hypothetical protein [Acidithiobacillus thiooxidans]
MSTTASTTSTGVYVLTCSSPASFYYVVPDATAGTASGQNVLTGQATGSEIVAACTSPAWVPYVVPFTFTESSFLTLAPAIMALLAATAGAKWIINFMRGRR